MEITPDKQNIDQLFSNTTYYIDFYQRDYKWNEEPVLRLLDDMFYKFNQEYLANIELEPKKEIISNKYSWYYLNTYVTNTVDGKVYVVDGQQRLTTLTIILIKLYHLSKNFESKTNKWLESKIAGYSGMEFSFWMNHEKHKQILIELFELKKDFKIMDVSTGITAKNILNNYQVVDSRLNIELHNQHKFETFTFYFLYRLVIINLSVEQTEVPMVFEVINDRGIKLKPYEILKGKLLGQIDKIELESGNYNLIWEEVVVKINSFKDDEIDNFFRYYLKSKFSDTRKEGTNFDGDYHRELFSEKLNKNLNLKHNSVEVKSFLNNTFKYYSNLYIKILNAYTNYQNEYKSVYYNKLNEMDAQFLLILSSCSLNDKNENIKIEKIAYEIDRLFSLLQLQNAYDSNSFNDIVYKISSEIRDLDIKEVRKIFDKYLLEELGIKRNTVVNSPFQYSFFKNIGINLNTRFKRYFFARIDKFIADNINLNEKHPIEDLVSKTGAKTGFHIEHILSYNKENLSLFNGDEELFEQARNRLGGLLLLKGKDNISSNNEVFKEKLKSYANTLYWNETLREDTYKSKLDMDAFQKKFKLNLKPLSKFGQEELESRQKILFEISKYIWE